MWPTCDSNSGPLDPKADTLLTINGAIQIDRLRYIVYPRAFPKAHEKVWYWTGSMGLQDTIHGDIFVRISKLQMGAFRIFGFCDILDSNSLSEQYHPVRVVQLNVFLQDCLKFDKGLAVYFFLDQRIPV